MGLSSTPNGSLSFHLCRLDLTQMPTASTAWFAKKTLTANTKELLMSGDMRNQVDIKAG